MKKNIIVTILFCLILWIGYVLHIKYNNSFKNYIHSDKEYIEKIILDSENINYKVENLYPIVGPYELENFIKSNSSNPQIYIPSENNIISGTFRANFHAHTTNSDGLMTIQEYLDKANDYAQKIYPEKFYIAVTDHNNMQTGKDIIEILQKNPGKYKNLKIVLGLEVFSTFNPKPYITRKSIPVHIISLAVNPYDKELNCVFKDLHNGKLNYSKRSYESAIRLLTQKGLLAVAHPAKYVSQKNVYNDYKRYYAILFGLYKFLTPDNIDFTEAYYQSYHNIPQELNECLIYIIDNFNIYKSGSIDNHGKSIFARH